ncbi:MAG: rhodanese-like domain-containing protein, partial [Campylobacterota bacterium]
LAKFLIAEGYKNVKVYAAGMPNWKKAGFETTKRKVIAPQEKADKKIEIVHGVAKGVDEGSVDGEWFKSKLNKLSSNLQIVDVRPKADFNTGHLKGAINIYAEEMSPKEFYKALPKNKTIVISCVSGGRALEAWMKLNDANLDVSKIFYFDAYIDCTNNQCKIEVNEPLD